MRKARGAKPQRKKKNILLRVACAAFAVYVVVQVISLQIQLREKSEQLEKNNQEIHRMELLNEDKKEKIENSEKYTEEKAYDQGFCKPGEQVYQVVPGK